MTAQRTTGARVSGLILVGSGTIGQFVVMVSGILQARMLGVEGRGQLVLIAALASMASQLTLGSSMANAITRTLAARQVTARDGLRRLVARGAVIALAVGLVAGLYFFYLHRDEPQAVTAFLAVSVLFSVAMVMALRLIVASLFGEGAPIGRLAFAVLFPLSLNALFLAIGYAIDRTWSVIGVTLLILASGFISIAVSFLLFRQPTRNPQDALASKDLWKLARRQYFGSLGPIDGLPLDRTLVGSAIGNVGLGLYSAAQAVSSLITALCSGLSQLLLPRITALQLDPEAERHYVRRALLGCALVILVCSLALEAIARPVIGIAFGREFLPAVACGRWMIVAGAFLGFRRILIAVLQARDRSGRASLAELAGTPVVVVGIILSARAGSLVGVAYSLLAAALVACAILGILVFRSGRHRSPRRPPVDPEAVPGDAPGLAI